VIFFLYSHRKRDDIENMNPLNLRPNNNGDTTMSAFNCTVTLDAITLRTALLAVSAAKAETSARHGLDSVFVRASTGTVEMVATDGHRLHRTTIATDTVSGDVTAVLDGESIDRLCKALRAVKVSKRATAFPSVTLKIAPEGAHAEIADPNGADTAITLRATYRTHDYPDFEAVIPKRDPEAKGSYFGVDPAYISQAADCAGQISCTARIQPGETAVSPVLITAEGAETTFLAVVMPRRLS
jgi:hypothetical protein